MRTSENMFFTFMADFGFPFTIIYTASVIFLLFKLLQMVFHPPVCVHFPSAGTSAADFRSASSLPGGRRSPAPAAKLVFSHLVRFGAGFSETLPNTRGPHQECVAQDRSFRGDCRCRALSGPFVAAGVPPVPFQ